jgi:hypothetical protein
MKRSFPNLLLLACWLNIVALTGFLLSVQVGEAALRGFHGSDGPVALVLIALFGLVAVIVTVPKFRLLCGLVAFLLALWVLHEALSLPGTLEASLRDADRYGRAVLWWVGIAGMGATILRLLPVTGTERAFAAAVPRAVEWILIAGIAAVSAISLWTLGAQPPVTY